MNYRKDAVYYLSLLLFVAIYGLLPKAYAGSVVKQTLAEPFPVTPILYFTPSSSTSSWTIGTDEPQHPVDLAIVQATIAAHQVSALQVQVSDLDHYDCASSPRFQSPPVASDADSVIFWARGDAATPAVYVEWGLKDGSNWITSVPITQKWRKYILSPQDFHPLGSPAQNTPLGFPLTQAIYLSIGVDGMDSHSSPGPHEYWIAQIGFIHKPTIKPNTILSAPVANIVNTPSAVTDTTSSTSQLQSVGPPPPPTPLLAGPPPVLVSPTETALFAVPGQTLEFSGPAYTSHSFDHSQLEVDGKIVATRLSDTSISDHYDYRWVVPSGGIHYVNIQYPLSNGTVVGLRHITVTALDTAPVTITGAPSQAVNDVTVQASPAANAQMQPTRLECFEDGVSVGTSNGASGTFTLPLHKADPGPHYITVQATDADGNRFVTPATTIVVPQRIMLTIPPAMTLQHFGDGLPFSLSLAPGVNVSKVTYAWGQGGTPDQDLMTTASSPFSTTVSTDAFATGNYTVQARAVTDDGTIYTSPVTTLQFTNQAEANREARLAQQEAEAAQVAAARVAAAKAAAAAEAQKQRDIIYNEPPTVPGGETGKAAAVAIENYLLNGASVAGLHLHEIEDIKPSRSLIYPENVNAILIDKDLMTYRWVLEVNPTTEEVSDFVKNW